MTSNILVFTPKAEVDASVNLFAFIAICKEQLTVFGADLPFDEFVWDITEAVQLKGHGSMRVRISFSTLETADSVNPAPMQEPFCSFAKACVRYLQGMRPTKNPAFRVTALRALDAALRECEQTNPAKIDGDILNRAANHLINRLSPATAYRVGAQLELIATFLADHRLTITPPAWHSHIKRPIDTVRVGQEFDLRRAEKMPSQAALEALPRAFYIAKDPKDLLFSSIAAILCSAPDRINEVLLLSENCEVHDKTASGQDAYGLRWWPAKGADPMVKWIIPSMARVISEAIERIRRVTANTREIALWYDSNPNKLFLPQDQEHFRTQDLLSMEELNEIIWTDCTNRTSALAWCRANNIPTRVEPGQRATKVGFADVEKELLTQLPPGFPYLNREIGIRYSEALFITRRNELHPNKATFRSVINAIDINQVNTELGARAEHGFVSLFGRLGFTEPDGSPIQVTTHQFRHYLNTLAQAGGMSQLDIAKWSGRTNIRENNAYDHVSADQMVAQIRRSIGDDSQMFGPLAKLPKNIPISRDEFARLKIPTAHTTDFGFCVHDYTMTPCEQFADCINCNEHICVKGDAHKAAMVRRRLEEAQDLLSRAKIASDEGYYGANRWLDHHEKTVTRLSQLAAILDDDSVPSGAMIQLSDIPTISQTQQAIEDRSDWDGELRALLMQPDQPRLPKGE
ncbi:integrase [Silvimonas amylolytica]|uniref:DNA-binding protein n=1 Tax=Silvimonas amylolytica TaxID=449663 RepID=A0ABQ2PMS0_9NEIS|nr:integrase [Silvimonas amylolytica]GGP26762.1 DNA-binding protein [Silvimonas amylolytica]